jgi:transposase
MENSASSSLPIVAWVGLDWADQAHAVCLQAAGSSHLERCELKHTAEALQLWVAELRSRFPQGRVAIALEQSRGALFYALMTYDFLVLYPIPPKALADYRKALYPSGSKDDPGDAQLLLEFLRKHLERFRPWVADDAPTREIAFLVQHRRKLVDDRTALTNRLQALLKGYFPQALEWAGDLTALLAWDFISQFPSLEEVQKASRFTVLKVYRAHTRRTPEQLEQLLDQIRTARPLTTDRAVIESSALMARAQVDQLRALAAGLGRLEEKLQELFAAHPDQAIFTSFPGAGPALAPRLLAAWGTDRQRFQAAQDMECLSGAAPVTDQSGKKCWVHWRRACPKFLRQTFHEFAGQSILWSPWARAYYQQMRQRGLDHHPVVRSLAFKWIRILYRCWKDHTLYDEARYQKALQRRGSPLAADLRQLSTQEARA